MGLVILFVTVLLVYDLNPDEKESDSDDAKLNPENKSRIVDFNKFERA